MQSLMFTVLRLVRMTCTLIMMDPHVTLFSVSWMNIQCAGKGWRECFLKIPSIFQPVLIRNYHIMKEVKKKCTKCTEISENTRITRKDKTLKQCSKPEVIYAPCPFHQGIVGTVWRHFWFSRPGKGLPLTSNSKGAAKHIAMHRIVSKTNKQKYPAQSTEGEKPQFKVLQRASQVLWPSYKILKAISSKHVIGWQWYFLLWNISFTERNRCNTYLAFEKIKTNLISL